MRSLEKATDDAAKYRHISIEVMLTGRYNWCHYVRNCVKLTL